ncbi:MAG TPA: tyrosine-type recombinase/integrase [Polyangiaceae bacterium LLY-WYZ-14_1]|nr:tyrosine-type recombinase/integrase [Polyangiaceae bacterium LLY-WYZ-14_1]
MAVLKNHARAIERVRFSGEGRKDVHTVDGVSNLRLIVTSTGAKSWHWRYTTPEGKRRRVKVGDYPRMSLADARARIVELEQEKRATGTDPLAGPLAADGTGGGPNTLRALFAAFLTWMEAEVEAGRLSARTLQGRRRILEGDELAPLRSMAPGEVRPENVARVLDAWEGRGALVAMNRAQNAISAAFAWASRRRLFGVVGNPVGELERRHREVPRDRVLSDEEIAALWNDPPGDELTGAALRLLLLTGQRSGEVRKMRVDHIDGSVWTMPRGYRKRTRADRGRPAAKHVVHLSPPAVELLGSIRKYSRGGFVFPNRSGSGPRDRQSLARAVSRAQPQAEDPWTPHDLRRTVRSRLADLGVDAVVAEKVIGHALPPILRTYDRSEQLSERAEALDRWADRVLEIAGG